MINVIVEFWYKSSVWDDKDKDTNQVSVFSRKKLTVMHHHHKALCIVP